jgi:hypothetical protein
MQVKEILGWLCCRNKRETQEEAVPPPAPLDQENPPPGIIAITRNTESVSNDAVQGNPTGEVTDGLPPNDENQNTTPHLLPQSDEQPNEETHSQQNTSSSAYLGLTNLGDDGNNEDTDSEVIDPEQLEDIPELSQAWENLRTACEDLETSYTAFAKANTNILRIDTASIIRAVKKANENQNLDESTKYFRTQIHTVLQATDTAKEQSEKKWTHRLGTTLSHLYPAARICLGAAKLAGEVHT